MALIPLHPSRALILSRTSLGGTNQGWLTSYRSARVPRGAPHPRRPWEQGPLEHMTGFHLARQGGQNVNHSQPYECVGLECQMSAESLLLKVIRIRFV